jgi:hypothetical protein
MAAHDMNSTDQVRVIDRYCPHCFVPVSCWSCAHFQVYEYFVSNTNAMAIALGKAPVRWEEVWKHFRTSLDPATIIQCWLSSAALIDATNNGYRAIFSVDSNYYLDYIDTTWDFM